MANNNWIKTNGPMAGILAAIIAILMALLINPMKENVARVEKKCDENSTKISAGEIEIGAMKRDIQNTDKNLERLMRSVDVPPVKDVPAGEYPTDAPGETK